MPDDQDHARKMQTQTSETRHASNHIWRVHHTGSRHLESPWVKKLSPERSHGTRRILVLGTELTYEKNLHDE